MLKYESSFGLVTHQGKLLLLLRDNIPTINDPNTWCLIGGTAEEGETPEQTLLREIEEEVGVKPSNYKFLYIRQDKPIYIYFVPLTDEEASRLKLGDEGQKFEFFNLDEVENLHRTQGTTRNWPTYRKILEKLLNGFKVSAAFVTYNHKILLFHRDNIPTIVDPDKWDSIGGHAEENETPEETLIREVEEEISIHPTTYKYLFTFAGYWNEEISLYHVSLIDQQAKDIELGDEGQEVKFFSFEEMGKLPLSTNLQTIYQNHQALIKSLLT